MSRHGHGGHSNLVTDGDQSVAILDGGILWASSDELGWVKAKVVDGNKRVTVDGLEGIQVTVLERKHSKEDTGRTISVALVDLLPISELDEGTELVGDVLDLQVLHDASVFETLRLRYFEDKIYTQAGPTSLISINPYKQIVPLYTQRAINMYSTNAEGAPPHVFRMAQSAYNNLVDHSLCQSILCSGESGAGKTEVAKLVVQYLAATTSKESSMSGGGSKVNPLFQTRQVQNQIIESNPLLESFGNAKTVRNENSSRFGKFIQILFSTDHTICGGRVRHYLLEKARVVSQHQGERNYHVFYQMCAGLSPEMRTRLSITEPQDFFYLSQSGVYELLDMDGKKLCDEVAEFSKLEKSMVHMRIEPDMQALVWQTIAAILHLGNIDFDSVDMKSEGEGSVVRNPEVLKLAAGLLDCPVETLQQGLTYVSMKVTGEAKSILVPQNPDQSSAARDALTKVIYEKLFAWLVGCINSCLSASDLLSQMTDAERRKVESQFIGVLDIFGFEVFEHNSFEQLCINYANESLQQQFINQMLHAMMDQYKEEGVVVDSIPFEDNSPCVELLEGKLGVFALLDDECNFPKGSDDDFLGKLMDRCKGHSHLKPGGSSSDPHLKDGSIQSKTQGSARVASSKTSFVVSHFAGEVEYNVYAFLEKNRDTINDSLRSVLRSSQQPLMAMLLEGAGQDDEGAGESKPGRVVGGRRVGGASRVAAGAKSRGASSVTQRQADKRSLGAQFKQQLSELVKLIESGRAHYVRCVKPNSLRKAHTFEAGNVLRQLRCSGVTETVRARRAGWPVSHTFADFVSRYGEVYCQTKKGAKRPAADECEPILEFFIGDKDAWRVGKKKVFVRDGASSLLEEKYKTYRLNCKLLLQARAKATLQRIRYLKMEGAAIAVQKSQRMWMAVAARKAKMSALRKLQNAVRALAARRTHRARRLGAYKLQSASKMALHSLAFAAKRKAGKKVEAGVRRGLCQSAYSRQLRALIEKEREATRRAKEEVERTRLAEEERRHAEAESNKTKAAEAKGDEQLNHAQECVEVGKVGEARQCIESALEIYSTIGGADSERKSRIAELEKGIEKAKQRLNARDEADEMLNLAQKHMAAEGGDAKARACLEAAKTSYERALEVELSRKTSDLIRALDGKLEANRQRALGLQAAQECREAIEAGDVRAAKGAFTRAEAGISRSKLADKERVIEELLKEVEAAEKAKSDEEEKEKRMKQALEEEQENELKRAEEQAKGMKQEDDKREKEAALMRQQKSAAEQEKMDTKMAVQVGGFGQGEDGVKISDININITTPASKKAAVPNTPSDVTPIILQPDAKLEVLKEGWLLKQSKKLKKWQKRYFVLDQVALYYCRNPTSVPDGFFAIRRCQFHYSEKTCCFDVITPSRVFRMQTPSIDQLREWAACYKQAMAQRDFPYFHVEQTTRLDLSRELLLGVMSTGLRMVKLGLYDPGFEEEIAFFTFDEIYSWGASDLETFEFRVASERMPYVFKTMYASDIEQKLEARFSTWREWRIYQATTQKGGSAPSASTTSTTPAGRRISNAVAEQAQ